MNTSETIEIEDYDANIVDEMKEYEVDFGEDKKVEREDNVEANKVENAIIPMHGSQFVLKVKDTETGSSQLDAHKMGDEKGHKFFVAYDHGFKKKDVWCHTKVFGSYKDAKSFVVELQKCPEEKRCFYEQFKEGKPVFELYDIESGNEFDENWNNVAKIGDDGKQHKGTIPWSQDKFFKGKTVKDIYLLFIKVREEFIKEYKYNNLAYESIIVSDSSSIKADKFSIHIVVRSKFAFKNNNVDMKIYMRFFKDFARERGLIIDVSACGKNRNMRTILSHKFPQEGKTPRPFIRANVNKESQNSPLDHFMITNVPDDYQPIQSTSSIILDEFKDITSVKAKKVQKESVVESKLYPTVPEEKIEEFLTLGSQQIDVEYANEYDKWFWVCSALRHIQYVEYKHCGLDLKPIFDSFSQRSAKYDKKACNAEWNKPLSMSEDQKTMGSFRYWWEKSNPKGYEKACIDLGVRMNRVIDQQEVLLLGGESTQARLFSDLNKDNIHIIDEVGNGYMGNDTKAIWEPCFPNQIKVKISDFLAPIANDYLQKSIKGKEDKSKIRAWTKAVNHLRSNAGAHNIAQFAKIYLLDKDFERKLNPSNETFPMCDGKVWNFREQKCAERTLGDLYSIESPQIKYMDELKDEDLKPEQEYLDGLFGLYDGLSEYVRAVLALCLSCCTERRCYIFHGEEGANGKSALLEAMEKMLGIKKFMNIIRREVLIGNKIENELHDPQKPTEYLFAFKNPVRLCCFSELPENARINETMLKSITGEDAITGRKLNKPEETFRSYAKIIMCCNKIFKFNTNSQPMLDRLSFIPFHRRFVPNPDPKNKYEMKANKKFVKGLDTAIGLSRFFTYLVRAPLLKRYFEDGEIPRPDIVKNYTISMTNSIDPFHQMFIKRYEVTNNEKDFILKSDITEEVAGWLDVNRDLRDYVKSSNKVHIWTKIMALFPKLTEKKYTKEKKIHVFGIKIRKDEEDTDE